MSVDFESNRSSIDTNRIKSQQFSDFSQRMWIYNMSDSTRFVSNPWSSTLPVVHEEDDSNSSSSIGNNSDSAGGCDSGEDDGVVQSTNNAPMNGLSCLEEVLPFKRGISTFYTGKSKSYGSLSEASSAPSIQHIVKPEDAYSRKRKNMLAHHVLFDKHRKSITDSGVSKRIANSNSHSNEIGENSNSDSNSKSSITGRSLPPLPRNRRLQTNESSNSSSSSSHRLYSSPWRSLSLSDLQQASATMSNKSNNDDEY